MHIEAKHRVWERGQLGSPGQERDEGEGSPDVGWFHHGHGSCPAALRGAKKINHIGFTFSKGYCENRHRSIYSKYIQIYFPASYIIFQITAGPFSGSISFSPPSPFAAPLSPPYSDPLTPLVPQSLARMPPVLWSVANLTTTGQAISLSLLWSPVATVVYSIPSALTSPALYYECSWMCVFVSQPIQTVTSLNREFLTHVTALWLFNNSTTYTQ